MSVASSAINEKVIHQFIGGDYQQIHCEKCEMTFLTNVYRFGAIHNQGLTKVPNIHRVGILDEDDNIVASPSQDEIYSGI